MDKFLEKLGVLLPFAIVIGGTLAWALLFPFLIAGMLQWFSYIDYIVKTFGG